MIVRCGITMSTGQPSRSTWYPLPMSQSRASRGEKLNINHQQYEQASNTYGSLHHVNENKSQICGSNPLIGQLSQSTANQFSWDTSKKIKLEMEEFGDLTAYLPTHVMSSYKNEANNVDELNTPVFERRGPFEFSQQYNTYDNQTDAVHTTDDPFDFKIKVEEFDFSCLYANNNNNNNNTFDTQTMDNYLVNQQTVQDTNNIVSSKGDLISSFKDTTPMYNQKMATTPTTTEGSGTSTTITTVADLTDILFDSNCGQYLVIQNGTEDSNSNSGSETAGHTYPKLKLNITGKIIENASTLSTPEVIETIADIENENFNILDIVNEKEFGSVSTDDLNLELDHASTPSPPQTVARSCKSRKRKARDDSDDDYEPPSTLRIGRKSIKMSSSSHYDSDNSNSDDDDGDDDDDEEEVEMRKARRGRPPKRNMSISSDSSKECDAVRYRELRDKNNEASRRSRLKRKMKELSLEKEATELEGKNVKLKTQVEELEKTVNNFRTNLFKIIMSNK